MEHREEYKKVFFTVKSDEIKDELANLEIQKIRSQARNKNLMENIQRLINQDEESSMRLLRMRKNLEEQKLNFVKEMNHRDPNWQDKMKNRKLLEI